MFFWQIYSRHCHWPSFIKAMTKNNTRFLSGLHVCYVDFLEAFDNVSRVSHRGSGWHVWRQFMRLLYTLQVIMTRWMPYAPSRRRLTWRTFAIVHTRATQIFSICQQLQLTLVVRHWTRFMRRLITYFLALMTERPRPLCRLCVSGFVYKFHDLVNYLMLPFKTTGLHKSSWRGRAGSHSGRFALCRVVGWVAVAVVQVSRVRAYMTSVILQQVQSAKRVVSSRGGGRVESVWA